jgi:hypothetical protein
MKNLRLLFCILAFLFAFSNTSVGQQNNQKQFSGKIKTETAEGSPIEMQLTFADGNKINGNYYYKSNGADIILNGTITGTRLQMEEFANKGVKTGEFMMTYDTIQHKMYGKWKNASGSKAFDVVLEDEEWTSYKIKEIKKDKSFNYGRFDFVGSFYYPIILWSKDTITQKVFNRLILDNIGSFMDSSYFQLLDTAEAGFSGLSQDHTASINLKNDYFISIGVWYSDYLGGLGANNEQQYILFDLKKQKEILLEDIFRHDIDFIDSLQQRIVRKITERGEWEYWNEDYVSKFDPGEPRFVHQYYLDKDGFWFYFPRPGAITNILGIGDVFIPYSELTDIINDQSEVSLWLNTRKH